MLHLLTKKNSGWLLFEQTSYFQSNSRLMAHSHHKETLLHNVYLLKHSDSFKYCTKLHTNQMVIFGGQAKAAPHCRTLLPRSEGKINGL